MGAAAGIVANIQQELIGCAIHYEDTNNNAVNAAAWLTASEDLSQGYHLYQMSWTPTNPTFSLDNVPFGSWDITDVPMFQQPMFLILNLAIGGYDPVLIRECIVQPRSRPRSRPRWMSIISN